MSMASRAPGLAVIGEGNAGLDGHPRRSTRRARGAVRLLALSGVRVRTEALARLGMTLPGFIERGNVIASLPSLSLLTLAAHVPEGWHVEYQEADTLSEDVISELCSCDVVAISALTARILDAYTLADRLRAAGVLVVLGGLHVSALPGEALAHADAVVKGEGEPVFAEVLGDLASGHSRGIYSRAGFDLRECRVPRYDLLQPERYNRLTLQTTRGCPLDCDFCAASRTISQPKRKPIARIRSELEHILELWPRPFIELADDNTFVSKRWSQELCELFASYPVRWFTETDISVADDEPLLDALARSGCAQLLIGFESARADALAGLDSADFKHRRYERAAERIRRIQARGISVNGCFVLGFDQDDASIFEQTRDYVRAVGLTEVQVTILTPFPGTGLERRLAREGRLLEPVYWDKCTLFDVTYRPKLMSTNELESGFQDLMRSLYSSEETAQRRQLMRAHLRRRTA
ncbi:MAG TPA: radical SAM protein [Polyangiaceae bacterium]|nr:radical SAM protein [Polyangiaceae bacterium]